MAETREPGTNLTNKCSDTTDVSILNTSQETQKPNSRQERQTRSKRRASGTNVSSVRPVPPPRYLVTDLNRLTFTVGGIRYPADDTDHTAAWIQFVSEQANVKGEVDWNDLEERAHFLNMLFVHCEARGKPFPLEETPETTVENFNAR